jgi:hypothetical protein
MRELSSSICIVPCGKAKVWQRRPDAGAVPARSVYIGSFATAARCYAEHFFPGAWWILSARHGFLRPGDLVPGPYDASFAAPTGEELSVPMLRAQAAALGLDQELRLVVVAGSAYVAVCEAVFGDRVRAPLRGQPGLGRMLRALRQAVLTATPL